MRANDQRGVATVAFVVMLLSVFILMGGITYTLVGAGVKKSMSEEWGRKALDISYSRLERAKTYLYFATREIDGQEVLDTNDSGYLDDGDALASNEVILEDDAEGKLTVYGNFTTFCPATTVQDHFIIKSSGIFNGTYRSIEVLVAYTSFLKFARFVQTSISYAKGATLKGVVYAGTGISCPTNEVWPNPPSLIFKKDVICGDTMTNKGTQVDDHHWHNVTVEGDLTENSTKVFTVNIQDQFTTFRGAAINCGLFIDSSNEYALGDGNPEISPSGGENDNLIDLSLFRDLGTTGAYYEGPDGNIYLPSDFNGIIWWEGSDHMHVKGTLQGMSISVFSMGDIYIDDSIYTGKDANNMPVNFGIVAGERIRMSQGIPRVFRVNAALLAANFNSTPGYDIEDSDYSIYDYDQDNSHPLVPPNTDIDADGVLESPNEFGWDEVDPDDDTWYFNIYGPLVTRYGGSSKVYAYFGNNNPSYTTRTWDYDVDIMSFPPPFPVIKNSLEILSFRESDTRI